MKKHAYHHAPKDVLGRMCQASTPCQWHGSRRGLACLLPSVSFRRLWHPCTVTKVRAGGLVDVRWDMEHIGDGEPPRFARDESRGGKPAPVCTRVCLQTRLCLKGICAHVYV